MKWRLYSVRQVKDYRYVIIVATVDEVTGEFEIDQDGILLHSISLPFGTVYKGVEDHPDSYTRLTEEIRSSIEAYEAELAESNNEQLVRLAIESKIDFTKLGS